MVLYVLPSIVCILCFCIALYIVSQFVHSCTFAIFVQVYRLLPPGGNPITVNKYQIIYHFVVPRPSGKFGQAYFGR